MKSSNTTYLSPDHDHDMVTINSQHLEITSDVPDSFNTKEGSEEGQTRYGSDELTFKSENFGKEDIEEINMKGSIDHCLKDMNCNSDSSSCEYGGKKL